MDVRKGDRVLVNVAPFIGSATRCDDSVPCEVLAVDGLQAQVRVEPPYRDVALWVPTNWIDGRLDQKKNCSYRSAELSDTVLPEVVLPDAVLPEAAATAVVVGCKRHRKISPRIASPGTSSS
jgi:hypothetical protein